MRIAYLDCFSGVSGDMFLGCLLDAGLPFSELNNTLRTLPIQGYRIDINREARNQIFGTRFMVRVEEGEHDQRGLKEIREIIGRGDLSRPVKEKSIEIFEALAGVEGEIHNLRPEEIHFHEVGAVDSIIDIVGTVYAVERMDIRRLYVSTIPVGSGLAKTAHGMIPIPAPATMARLRGVPLFDSGVRHEMVTPTGAALVRALGSSFGPMPPMVVREIGYGVGSRDLSDRPNLLRIIIGEDQFEGESETVIVLETNLDDISPEWSGYLMDRLFDAGALDVVFIPVNMKKNRPGIQIQVIGRPDQRDVLTDILIMESATLGVRYRYCRRRVVQRSYEEVESPWGGIKVKQVFLKEDSPLFVPEYEACREIASKRGIPLRDIYNWVATLNRG